MHRETKQQVARQVDAPCARPSAFGGRATGLAETLGRSNRLARQEPSTNRDRSVKGCRPKKWQHCCSKGRRRGNCLSPSITRRPSRSSRTRYLDRSSFCPRGIPLSARYRRSGAELHKLQRAIALNGTGVDALAATSSRVVMKSHPPDSTPEAATA